MNLWVTFTTGPDGGGYIIPLWFAEKLVELQEEGEYEEGYPKIEGCLIYADPPEPPTTEELTRRAFGG